MSVRRTTAFLAGAAVAVMLALSGCASSSNDSGSTASKADAPQQGVPREAEGAAGAGPANDAGAQVKDPQKAPDNLDAQSRSIIYSGTMTLEVKDVNAAAAQAIALATAAGGFVGADNRQINGTSSTGTLTLRVPAAKFSSTLDALHGIGDEQSRQISAQDVTDQVADVDSRLRTAQSSVDRIRELMAKAQTIGEITSLESELSRRESDLESLQARKRRLDGLTALSTIALVLHGPDAPTVSKEDTGIVVGLRNGWTAFVASLRVALTVLGWLLPWLVFVGLPIFVIVRIWRRYRPKRAPAPVALAPAMPGLPPMPPMPPGPMPHRPAPPAQRTVAQPSPVPGGIRPDGEAVPGQRHGEATPAKPSGETAVSPAGDGAEAQPTRAPEAAAPHRSRPEDEGEGPSGPAPAR